MGRSSKITADSEDSDNDGGMGNVTRLVMRPPGHSGKAKRGHLCFDASFETGNLGRIDFTSEFEYDLFIRPDTCNPRHRLWFNFVIDNTRLDQRVILNIVNIGKTKNLFREGMTPLVRSTSRNKKWYRMLNRDVYYHRSNAHRKHYVLSLIFAFDKEEDAYQISFSYPYSYSKCKLYLDTLEKKKNEFFHREVVNHSIQKRNIDVVTITDLKMNENHKGKLRVVVILSRVHPGESPTSFICQGIIDLLISNHHIAKTLRSHVVFKIFPMLNPDGVFLGNFRSNYVGLDLNRSYHHISEWSHPGIYSALTLITSLNQDKNLELDFIIDLHAHSSLKGLFIYGNSYDDIYRFERHTILPKLLANNAEDYDKKNTIFNRVLDKLGTARRVFSDTLKDTVNCYSLIVSFFGYIHPVTKELIPYKEESYERIGRVLIKTFLEYYTITGVIPSTPDQITKELMKKKKQKMKSMSTNKPSSRVARPVRTPSCQPLSKTVLGTIDEKNDSKWNNNKPSFVTTKMRKPFKRRKKSKIIETEQLNRQPEINNEDGNSTNRKLNIIDINNITLISSVN
uniref:Cytosolic carboxypeptidase 6 n=2 Tax=Cacopsylla melanoneura TaxID=428564 RepID=A0A8D8VZJ2_9HEMI